MSGYPSPDQVARLKECVAEMTRLEQTVRERKAVIAACKSDLENLEHRHTKLSDEVLKSMEKMDLRYSGNFGWESRMFTFLAELITPTQE